MVFKGGCHSLRWNALQTNLAHTPAWSLLAIDSCKCLWLPAMCLFTSQRRNFGPLFFAKLFQIQSYLRIFGNEQFIFSRTKVPKSDLSLAFQVTPKNILAFTFINIS